MIALKPCPFCHGKAQIVAPGDRHQNSYAIICASCPATMVEEIDPFSDWEPSDYAEELADAWNRRKGDV